MRKSAKNLGFTLVELSVVLVIIALIIASTVPAYVSAVSTARFTATKNKLVAITTALNTFYAKNHRLPCPASGALLSNKSITNGDGSAYTNSESTVGKEIYTDTISGIGLCDVAISAGNSAAPDGTFRYLGNDNATSIRQGVLPVRVLGLPDDMMYDGYKNKFTYAVTEPFTTSAVSGVITVNDGISSTAIPNTIMNNAVFVVVSHGKDGLGSWLVTGNRTACVGTIAVPYNTRDMENCGNHLTAGNRSTAAQPSSATVSYDDYYFTDSTFNDFSAKVNTTSWFDDIIAYENQNMIIGSQPNSRLSIRFTANTYAGNAVTTADCATDVNAGKAYHFCTENDIKTSNLPLTSAYPSTIKGWINGDATNTCLNGSSWNSNSVVVYGETLPINNGTWVTTATQVSCNTSLPVACCQ